MATTKQREHLARLMDLLVAAEPRVHYAQVRPMQTRHISEKDLKAALTRGITMDCSESVTLLCRLAGLKDPNGKDYNGTGYTGTLLGHLPHYTDASKAKVGALVVFGPGHHHDGDHVCMVRKAGPNPLLFSHGQERGPFYISLSEEKKYHPPPTTFLAIQDL
jgi:hypothetical protein